MNVFNLPEQIVADYSEYVRSYIQIADEVWRVLPPQFRPQKGEASKSAQGHQDKK